MRRGDGEADVIRWWGGGEDALACVFGLGLVEAVPDSEHVRNWLIERVLACQSPRVFRGTWYTNRVSEMRIYRTWTPYSLRAIHRKAGSGLSQASRDNVSPQARPAMAGRISA